MKKEVKVEETKGEVMREKVDLCAQLFVTGTDTNVGKTIVSSILLAGTGGSYWKPIQSGVSADFPETDTRWVMDATGLDADHFHDEAFKFHTPISPHLSAALDGSMIDLELAHPPEQFHKPLVIEGAGGIMVPLNEQELIIDLMVRLDAPVLVVARNVLGAINHTLLTVEALRHRGLTVLGVVLNGDGDVGNLQSIETYGGLPVLATVPFLREMTPATLRQTYLENFGPLARLLATDRELVIGGLK